MQTDIQQKIIIALGLEGADDAKREEVINSVGSLIFQRVLVQVTNALSDEDVISFEKVLSGGNQAELQAFLEEKVPNLDELVRAASAEVIAECQKGTDEGKV